MNWYIAKMMFRIVCGEGNHTAQFEEQLRLIQAKDLRTAFQKAQALGKKEEDYFLNSSMVPVYWKFINISDLYSLEKLMDGAEMYSRIYEEDQAERLIQQIHKKAELILENSSRTNLSLN
jgi:hypothetical protein